jgi:hypothetical protein
VITTVSFLAQTKSSGYPSGRTRMPDLGEGSTASCTS